MKRAKKAFIIALFIPWALWGAIQFSATVCMIYDLHSGNYHARRHYMVRLAAKLNPMMVQEDY